MREKILLLFILIHSTFFSQQNFINVPSAEVTNKNKLFFQQQINISEIIQSNSTFDYGLGKGFEVGVNILGLNFSRNTNSFLKNDTSDTDPYNPLLMINGLKYFKLSEKIGIAAGTQIGLNYRDGKKTKIASLAYLNFQVKDLLGKENNLVIGGYYNSTHYGGTGNRFGAWLGAEIPVVNKIHFMGESVLGYNAISYTSLGIVYYPTKHLPLTFGFQIPNSKNNSYSFVFELTFIP
ncbi:MAG: hypothetical protein SFY56_16325 [Bacteroidota bacterium]|nr:hypothetical protein [Bacteroidota bacterium]